MLPTAHVINHRYLGRRGCWLTAFNFAKLLFSLDPFVSCHLESVPQRADFSFVFRVTLMELHFG